MHEALTDELTTNLVFVLGHVILYVCCVSHYGSPSRSNIADIYWKIALETTFSMELVFAKNAVPPG